MITAWTSNFTFIILTLLPSIVFGQSIEPGWDNLSRLRAEQKIEVVDTKLRPIAGRFTSFSEHAISLRVGNDEISIHRSDVLSVKNREGSHRARNVLLGLAIGAAGGLAIGAIKGATYHEEGETPVFLALWTPIGAGIGGAVGVALPTGQVTIYRARSRAGP